MNKAKNPLLIVLTGVLSLSISCSRPPQENGSSTSAVSSNADANAASPEPTSGDAETQNPQRSDNGPSTGGFIGRDIDINSGDFRGLRPTLDAAHQYVIYESKLSKEVRRLGIPIPEERRWKVAGRRSAGGMDVYYVYESLPSVIHALMTTLDEADAPDEERRDVLERFMMSLRTDRAHAAVGRALELRDEVHNRHGLKEDWIPGAKATPTTIRSSGERTSSDQTSKDSQP